MYFLFNIWVFVIMVEMDCMLSLFLILSKFLYSFLRIVSFFFSLWYIKNNIEMVEYF